MIMSPPTHASPTSIQVLGTLIVMIMAAPFLALLAVPFTIVYGTLLVFYTASLLGFIPPAVKSLAPVISVAQDIIEGPALGVKLSRWLVWGVI